MQKIELEIQTQENLLTVDFENFLENQFDKRLAVLETQFVKDALNKTYIEGNITALNTNITN